MQVLHEFILVLLLTGIVGGILQATSGVMDTAAILGAAAILVATINIAGGFLVTQRMLAMFRR